MKKLLKQLKRPKTTTPSSSSGSIKTLHYENEHLHSVQTREAETVKKGAMRSVMPSKVISEEPLGGMWRGAKAWAPADNPEYALDPKGGEWYDIATLREDFMDELSTPQEPLKKSTRRSKVSKRPNVVWKETFRSSYLDQFCRLSGRGDFVGAKECPDCVAKGTLDEEAGDPIYRCGSDCFLGDLVCADCCLARHQNHPFHRIEKWTGTHFVRISLKDMGLKIQLHHTTGPCPDPTPCHSSMTVLHTNGYHEVAFLYCGCGHTDDPPYIQLLQRRVYPATQIIPKTCATLELLNMLHKLSITSKASTYDINRMLEKLTDNTGIAIPKTRYKPLLLLLVQFRHLKMLQRAGRAHEASGPDGTTQGELALECISCPIPGINVPDNWNEAPPNQQYLYTTFAAMDANFRLKNQLVSNYSQDPGLGPGLAYMISRDEYEKYVLSKANQGDISSCVEFQAIVQANSRYSVGLRYTGVGGIFCGRSEMLLLLGIGNLQKGERYANMDYVFASGLQNYHAVSRILISYDIACQWFVNLEDRLKELPDHLQFPASIHFTPAIPKLHEPMHEGVNHQQFSLNLISGVGLSDMEVPERFWAPHNVLGNATKTMGPGSRQDILDDHFSAWNWDKIIGLGKTLRRRYRRAVAEQNIQAEAHRGLTETIGPIIENEWEKDCLAWEEDSYPKSVLNPYEYKGVEISEVEVRNELAKDHEKRIAAGLAPAHTTPAGTFILAALDIEETQRRVGRMAKNKDPTITHDTNLTDQRSHLKARIKAWEILLPVYMPGLSRYQSDLAKVHGPAVVSEHPEDHTLWIPSRLAFDIRDRVCRQGEDLPSIEDRLRTAQCNDALDGLRHTLKIKARLVDFRNRNVRGQREGTRSRAIIDRVHMRAGVAADKYRAARSAKLSLTMGLGNWDQHLRVLDNKDIRTYRELEAKTRTGRRGIWEDGQVDVLHAGDHNDSADLASVGGRKQSSGETGRTLSWIWRVKEKPAVSEHEAGKGKNKGGVVESDSNEGLEGAGILKVEWGKSRGRANRAKEEVCLNQEEMRRSLVTLESKSKKWLGKIGRRDDTDTALEEGLRAVANKTSLLFADMGSSFQRLWQEPLGSISNVQGLDDDVDGEDSDDDGGDLGEEGLVGEEDEDD